MTFLVFNCLTIIIMMWVKRLCLKPILTLLSTTTAAAAAAATTTGTTTTTT